MARAEVFTGRRHGFRDVIRGNAAGIVLGAAAVVGGGFYVDGTMKVQDINGQLNQAETDHSLSPQRREEILSRQSQKDVEALKGFTGGLVFIAAGTGAVLAHQRKNRQSS